MLAVFQLKSFLKSEFKSKRNNASTFNLDISVRTAFLNINGFEMFFRQIIATQRKTKGKFGTNGAALCQVNLTHKGLGMHDFAYQLLKLNFGTTAPKSPFICQIQTFVYQPMSNCKLSLGKAAYLQWFHSVALYLCICCTVYLDKYFQIFHVFH